MVAGASSLAVFSFFSVTGRDLLPFFWAATICNAAGWGVAFSVISCVIATLFGTISYARNNSLVVISVAISSYSIVSAITHFANKGHGLLSYEVGLWLIVALGCCSAPPIVVMTYRWLSFPFLPLNARKE
jgi:hypothetical protein